MILKRLELRLLLASENTVGRFLSFADMHVLRPGRSLRNLHGTPPPAVRLLPCVDTSVFCQMAAGDEGFSAGIASVGSLACVNPHVRFDMSARAERRRTFSTLIGFLFRVNPSMRGEISSLSEV